MSLDTTVAQKLVTAFLENSPNPVSAIGIMKDAGVTIGEITQLAINHPPLKTRLNDIGVAVNNSGGRWPLALPEPKKAKEGPAYGETVVGALPTDDELKAAPHSFLPGDIKATSTVGTDAVWTVVKRGEAVPTGFTQSGSIARA